MDAGGAGLLCEAADGVLDVVRRDHHKVGQLVDDDDDGRHLVLGELRVVGLHIADVVLGKLRVALLHLLHRPVEHGGRLLGLRDDRDHEVRNAVVVGELDHLRVDEDELDLLWLRLEEDARDQRVDADRLTGARGTGDEQMRHLREVCEDGLAADVHAEADGQLRLRLEELLVLEDFAKLHPLELLVRHLDADGCLAGDRLDAHGCRGEAQREVVGEIRDLADLNARRRLELVARDGRPVTGIDDLRLDMEVLERLLQDVSLVGNLHLERGIVLLRVLREDLRDLRQHVGARRRSRCCCRLRRAGSSTLRTTVLPALHAPGRAVEQCRGRHDWRDLVVRGHGRRLLLHRARRRRHDGLCLGHDERSCGRRGKLLWLAKWL